MKIFFDGGCRPNPGRMEIAVVARGQPHILRDVGDGGCLEAEWLALIHALRIGRSLGVADIVLLGDSIAVVNQANRRARCPAACVDHLATFRALAAAGPEPRVRYIRRAQNLAGIALARLHVR